MLVTTSNSRTKDLSNRLAEEETKTAEEEKTNEQESKIVLEVAYGQIITFLPDLENLRKSGLIRLARAGNDLVALHDSPIVGESYYQQLTSPNNYHHPVKDKPFQFRDSIPGSQHWW